jgi:hypothetical protein
LGERLRETEVMDAWSKIVGDFIAACSNPRWHYELEQISKSEILRKLKQRFGGKTILHWQHFVGVSILACNELVPNLTYAWQFVVFGLVGGGGHLYNDFQTPSLL